MTGTIQGPSSPRKGFTALSTARKSTKTEPTKTARQAAVEAIAQARSLVAQREEQHGVAVANREALTARLASGDDAVTTVDMTEAASSVERAEILLNGAQRTLTAVINNANTSDRTTVAGIVADAVRPLLPGVKVEVTDSRPSRAGHDGQPIVYVHQNGPTKPAETRGGALTADVHIELHAAAPLSLSADVLGKAVEGYAQIATADPATGGYVSPMATGGYASVISVCVRRAFEQTPYMPAEPGGFHARLAAMDAIANLRNLLHASVADNALRYNGNVRKVATVDGKRHSLVQLKIGASNVTNIRPYKSLAEVLTAALVQLEGQYTDGLGRCETVKVEGHHTDHDPHPSKSVVWVTALVEYVATVA